MDARRKRLIYRCQHRGMKEVDALLGGFVGRHAAALAEREVTQLEALVDEPDNDLYNWITGKQPVPTAHDHDLMTRIRKFNNTL
jgi:antitoxin CptB